jgi:hypothetical protein
MTGDSVEDQVKGWVQRSYLKRDGWWAQLVLDEFSFLRDLGFTLTGSDWAGVHFHQRGHYVGYTGPRRDLAIGYDPEDTKTIDAHVVEYHPSRFIALDGLIAERLPEAHPPRRQPLDREAVEANVRWWADCLRRIAADVL